jgi:hypothetical protein
MPYSPLLEGERCNAPNTWTRTAINQATARAQKLIPDTTNVISYPTTWHHNIPWKILRDSWNIIYTFFSPETVSKVFDLYAVGNGTVLTYSVLRDKLLEIKSAVGPSSANASSGTCELWMSRLKAADGHLMHLEEKKQLTSSQSEELQSIVAWQRYNIVEGPKESVRVDDPGSDGFDDFRFIDDSLIERFQKVYAYNDALENLVKRFSGLLRKPCDLTGQVATEDSLLQPSLQGVVQTLATAPLVPFQLKHWRLVTVYAKQVNVDGQFYALVAKNNLDQV